MSEQKAYIGNLSYDTSEDSLRAAIEATGVSVKSVSVITDKMTGRARGFGFAEFETSEDLQKAIKELDGKELDGRQIKVNQAEERKPRRDSFGGGSGGGGRDRGGRGGRDRY